MKRSLSLLILAVVVWQGEVPGFEGTYRVVVDSDQEVTAEHLLLHDDAMGKQTPIWERCGRSCLVPTDQDVLGRALIDKMTPDQKECVKR